MEGKMLHRLSIMSLILLLSPVIISNSLAQGSLDQRVSELTQQISKEMTDNNKKTIAVIEFSDLRGNVTDLGRYISEELITKLYLTKKFKVIERQLLNKIIVEQKLSLAGMIDPSSAKKLGKVLGVEAIVSGTITDLAQSLKVNARMLNTETGEIFAAASVEIFKDVSVTKLMVPVIVEFSSMETKPSKPSTEPNKPKSWKVQDKGFSFELVGASRKASGTVVIEILVTNISETQQDLSLYAKDRPDFTTRLFDVDGTEYWPSKLKFGPQQSSNEIRKPMSVSVPTKAIFEFDNVQETMTNFAALDIGVYTEWRYNIWRVQLKNFSIK